MKKITRIMTGLILALTLALAGCGNKSDDSGKEVIESITESVQSNEESVEEENMTPPSGNYIELALNVYFNDKEHSYFENESGASIFVNEEGTYTVSFDVEKDLSDEAKAAGITELNNLTAVYILDMGAKAGNQSALTSCDIIYDEIKVNDTPLTITMKEPKSAFKSNGMFDTNDPINGWDGSVVTEVVADSNHAASFTTIDKPTNISVTFTLTGMVWEEAKESEQVTDMSAGFDGVNNAVYSNINFDDIDALTLVKLMGNGINLGNTMEAYGRPSLGTKGKVSAYETYWGQPVTTDKMIQGMKNCGFDTLRIPIAWTNMMDYESGDYSIDKAYMDRVEELVNYALDAEMFVIINDHWDGGWWSMFGSKTEATRQEAWDIYESIWTQIADRFKDYPEMLIFEAANEELGNSLNDNSHCPDSGSLSIDECYSLTNEINQFFVDLIRKSGGKNEKRFLLLAGYNTDIGMTVDNRFKMPKDVISNKLLLSVHYYTPWNYCGSEKQARWGLKADYKQMNELLMQLTKFTDEGYGIILGEYAALPFWENNRPVLKDNTVEFTKNFLDNCDYYNYCPVLWSCNDLYLKNSLSMATDELNELYYNRRYEVEEIKPEEIKAEMENSIKDALDNWPDVKTVPAGAPIAWIMWNGGAGTYSVGDTYNPSDNTAGIKATDAMIKGPGEYTVSLDFEGGNDGLTFAALAIANGERLFSKPIIEIKEILLDGKPIELIATPYTSSDDTICTRVNLYNAWVTGVPDGARNLSGDLSNASSIIVDKADFVGIKNITITFELIK